jgi:cytosine/adenosine deaminase-related metal-dependent hydrolase
MIHPNRAVNSSCHRAKWVMRSPGRWIENGIVEIRSGRIVDVRSLGKKPPQSSISDHGGGILMPPLVNCHTHLTLSALKDRVDKGSGFLAWTRSLLREREKVSAKEALEATKEALLSMKGSGVGCVGEFGPRFEVRELLRDAGFRGIVWREFLGEDRDVPSLSREAGEILESYAGHGPHTTSPILLRKLKVACKERGVPFSIHLAESKEEVDFLEKARGPWADFLRERGIDFSQWGSLGKRPVRLAKELGLLDEDTVAVHLLQVEKEEIEILAESGVFVCLCPRSNVALHGKVPHLEDFLRAGIRPCLGTDSLASGESLSVLDEIRFLAEGFPNVSPSILLEMATINGARALKAEGCGLLERGSHGRLLYVEAEASSWEEAEEILVRKKDLALRFIDGS